MKRFLSFFFVFTLFVSFFFPAHADNRNLTVYVASGSKKAYRYHAQSSCAGLKNSVVAQLTLAEASAKGFTPCQRCHPPAPDFPVEVSPRPSPSRSMSTSGGSGGSSIWTQTFTASPFIPEGQAAAFSSGSSRSSPSSPVPPSPTQESESSALLGYLLISALIVFAVFFWALAIPLPYPGMKAPQEQPAAPLALSPPPLPAPAAFPLSDLAAPFYVGEDGLPRCKDGDEKWGTGYTFYMTPKGRCFHTRNCEIGKKYRFHPVNAYTAKTGYRYYNGVRQSYRPCSLCRPVLPDLTWYEDLMRLRLWTTGKR